MLLTRLAEHAAHRSDLPPLLPEPHGPLGHQHRRRGTPAAPGLQDQAGPDQPAGQPLPAPYVYRSGQHPPAALLVDTLQYVLAVLPPTPGRPAPTPPAATATMQPCLHAGAPPPQEMRRPAPRRRSAPPGAT